MPVSAAQPKSQIGKIGKQFPAEMNADTNSSCVVPGISLVGGLFLVDLITGAL